MIKANSCGGVSPPLSPLLRLAGSRRSFSVLLLDWCCFRTLPLAQSRMGKRACCARQPSVRPRSLSLTQTIFGRCPAPAAARIA